MSERPVNLNRVRKAKARAAKRRAADANAARHGETKAVRSLRAAREELEARRLEGHQRDDARDDADEPG